LREQPDEAAAGYAEDVGEVAEAEVELVGAMKEELLDGGGGVGRGGHGLRTRPW
jgi:hypothetical protein